MSFPFPWSLIRSSARVQIRMSSSTATSPKPPLLEGVFAINKPAGLSSAQVVRDLQTAFGRSEYFKPWLKEEQERRVQEGKHQRMRRNKMHRKVQIKVGHGGTLDPGATGCLVIGIGKGTKHLGSFMECRKSYDATILFGAATDTYDSFGKLLATAPYEHVTKEKVEAALEQFRGDIKQQPPIFSALKMDGKKLYEYARAGTEPPREIAVRPAKVFEMEMTEWLEPGSHGLVWPTEVAEKDIQAAGRKILQLKTDTKDISEEGTKRKRSESPEEPKKEQKLDTDAENVESKDIVSADAEKPTDRPEPAAAKLHMVVGSGFYVRSLCHDLGKAVGSLGIMANLVRTQQAQFSLDKNVLAYEDFRAGEDAWRSKIQTAFQEWDDHLASDKKADPK